ncbi:MAG: oxidoreductase [Alcaligenaceae bacterium]|nr:MAG: oxidoreductase [Alcaligenaceae bacterium]
MSTPFLNTLVHDIRSEADGVVSVELRPASADVILPSFNAGAHIDLHLPNGLIRSYSLCNDPGDSGRYVVAVGLDRDSRGGSRYIHTQLAVGTLLQTSAPRNNFRLDETATQYVLVAGGIGVTPLYAMLQRLIQLGRQVTFIYCARSRKEAAFAADITAMAGEMVQVLWHFVDEAGRLPDLPELLSARHPDSRFYCCGPAPMLEAFVQTCEALNYPHAAIERFSGLADAAGAERAYLLELRRSGRTLQVTEGKTVLRVMLEAGLNVDFGCEEGVCGACETRVLEGVVDHKDDLLEKAEKASNKTMLICVSGCKSERLVLDL